MIDTYDMQICDYCGCEFSHSYFSGGTRTCTTCKIADSSAHQPHDELAHDLPDDDWFVDDTYTGGDLGELQITPRTPRCRELVAVLPVNGRGSQRPHNQMFTSTKDASPFILMLGVILYLRQSFAPHQFVEISRRRACRPKKNGQRA